MSVNNKNLTVLNINDVYNVKITKLTCLTPPQDTISPVTAVKYKDNMCLYVSNFYRDVVVDRVVLTNLVGIDNSFIVFSSWDILVYNTTQPGIRERINLTKITVTGCTIITQEISSVSASIFIESK